MNPKLNDDHWIRQVDVIGEASTCRADVGCILVQNNYQVGVGYVGSASGDHHCCDTNCLLVFNKAAGGQGDGCNCIRTIHAEQNAILKCTARGNKRDGWIVSYSSYEPCFVCTKLLVAIGVRKFVFRKPYRDIFRDLYLGNLHPSIESIIEWKNI